MESVSTILFLEKTTFTSNQIVKCKERRTINNIPILATEKKTEWCNCCRNNLDDIANSTMQ